MNNVNTPYGYCECGCGQKTSIAKCTSRNRGHIKGEPIRFIDGHNNKFRPQKRPAPITNSNGTITIHLTRKQVTVIDAIDNDLAPAAWYAMKHTKYGNGGSFIACGHINSGRTHVYLHRVIMERILGRPLQIGEEVDHRDCDPLNNCRSNLRVSSRSQNRANQRKSKSNTSGYKGVYFRKDTKKWTASIQVNKRMFYLGCFSSPEEAHEAYKKAAIKYFGEFARFE